MTNRFTAGQKLPAFILIALLWGCVDAVYYEHRALEQEGKGDFAKAAGFWEKVIEKAPDNYNAYMNMAYAHLQAGDTLRAIGGLTGAVSLKPAETDAWFFQAFLYAARGELLPALEDYKRLVRLYGERYRISSIEWEDGFFLAPHRTPVRKIDKRVGDAYTELGMVYYRLDSIPQAIATLEYCIETGYRPAECHYWLAMAYKRKGDDGLAAYHLRRSAGLGYPAAVWDLSRMGKD